MIASINGQTDLISDTYAVIECGGIGYRVSMPRSALFSLNPGAPVKVYTYTHVYENGLTLYGFLDPAELEMFNLLTSVPGVGPKAAVAILDILTPADITAAIPANDHAKLAKAQGVGKKTAQMICLKLKDKISGGQFAQPDTYTDPAQTAKSEATEALTALGFPRSDAFAAVLQTALPGMPAQDIIKAALKKLK